MKALIKSRPAAFRRAGIEFSRAGREIDLDALTQDQVTAICAEPNLEVTFLELPKKATREEFFKGEPSAPAVKPAKPAKVKATP